MNYYYIIFLTFGFAFFFSCSEDNTTNQIKNKFDTIQIGPQVWMLKNLDVEHYRNGDPIPEVKDSAQWSQLHTGAWCYYNNNPVNGAIYGKLYNWYALNDPRGLAPSGWHIPTNDEWKTLANYLGGENVAGGKMKESGTTHWFTPNEGATNSSGFTGLPGGSRYYNGSFYSIKLGGVWWSSTVQSDTMAWYLVLDYSVINIFNYSYQKVCALSVRCIKDN